MSIVERVSSSRRFQNVLITMGIGHYEVSFMRGCPFLGGSFLSEVLHDENVRSGLDTVAVLSVNGFSGTSE